MRVEGLVCETPDGIDDHGTNCDVGDESAIHDVHVNPVGARLIHRLDLTARDITIISGERDRLGSQER